jgi:hypothetical protein
MSDQSDRGATEEEREMREHERQAREHEPAERGPDAARDTTEQPAPPGNAEQSG